MNCFPCGILRHWVEQFHRAVTKNKRKCILQKNLKVCLNLSFYHTNMFCKNLSLLQHRKYVSLLSIFTLVSYMITVEIKRPSSRLRYICILLQYLHYLTETAFLIVLIKSAYENIQTILLKSRGLNDITVSSVKTHLQKHFICVFNENVTTIFILYTFFLISCPLPFRHQRNGSPRQLKIQVNDALFRAIRFPADRRQPA